jgi:hypothetical protein
MKASIRIAVLTTLLLASGPTRVEQQPSASRSAKGFQRVVPGQTPRRPPADQMQDDASPQVEMKRGVLKLNETTEKGLWKLPDDQLIEIEGKEVPLREVRRRMESEAKQSRTLSLDSKLPDLSAKLESERTSMLDEQAAKVQAELAKLKQGGGGRAQAIESEALQIQQRLKTAGPAQRAKDEARVQQLYQESQSRR